MLAMRERGSRDRCAVMACGNVFADGAATGLSRWLMTFAMMPLCCSQPAGTIPSIARSPCCVVDRMDRSSPRRRIMKLDAFGFCQQRQVSRTSARRLSPNCLRASVSRDLPMLAANIQYNGRHLGAFLQYSFHHYIHIAMSIIYTLRKYRLRHCLASPGRLALSFLDQLFHQESAHSTIYHVPQPSQVSQLV